MYKSAYYTLEGVDAMAELTGMEAQIRDAKEIKLHHGDVVIFDHIISQTDDIIYHEDSGVFEILVPGTYLVNWSIATDGSSSTAYVRFGLIANDEHYASLAYPVTVGVMSGTSLIKVTDIPTRLTLVNNSDDIVRLANIAPIATITIANVTDSEDKRALDKIIHSIALEEQALAGILYAEAKKIHAAINIPDVTISELLRINCSVGDTVDNITRLEMLLLQKLKIALRVEC